MSERRRAGVLLPVFSLPGNHGIGDLGPRAHDFLDWIAEAGLGVWQILPIGPTHDDGSPYAALSAHAGNPFLISPQWLIERGWLDAGQIAPSPQADARIDYAAVSRWKNAWLREASRQFDRVAPAAERTAFAAFCGRHGATWLDDWCRFEAVRRKHPYRSWPDWPEGFSLRTPETARRIDSLFSEEIRHHAFVQFLFGRQWDELAAAARLRGIECVGDLPFYPAMQSADVWSNRHLFRLTAHGHPEVVAGVPPDYFSEDGQRWGNPIYRWKDQPSALIDFWESRLRSSLHWTTTVRLDHFRAFVDYWEVPADESTAQKGRWVPGPGLDFFRALRDRLGGLPLIAEDLGDITEAVDRLRLDLGLPGMKIFQFGFGDDASVRRHTDPEPNSVTYTGTHDNDTIRGWFESVDDGTRSEITRRLNCDADSVAQAAIEHVLASRSNLAVIPLQDFLGLDSQARMNVPGQTIGNWGWRAAPGAVTLRLAQSIRSALVAADRLNTPEPTRS